MPYLAVLKEVIKDNLRSIPFLKSRTKLYVVCLMCVPVVIQVMHIKSMINSLFECNF